MNTIAQTTDGEYIVRLTPIEYHFLERELTMISETVIPLSESDQHAWRDRFLSELDQLHLSKRLFNVIMRCAPPTGLFWRTDQAVDVFVDQWVQLDGQWHIARLHTFEEWCQLVVRPDFAPHLHTLRNFGKVAYDRLVEAVTAYLDRVTADQAPLLSDTGDALEIVSGGVP